MDDITSPDNLLAPDYNPTEFAPLQLLEQGDVDVWVRRRGAILLEKSKETAKECEAGKLASVITFGASVVMSANPLAWVPMVIGASGYIYTVFQEFQDTGSIRLIPMYRGKLGDILRVMEGGIAEGRHPLLDQIEYLSEAEKDEVLLINYRFGEMAGVLNSAPPLVRFDLYRHVCSQFHARRDLISGDEVKHYINAAVSQERRTAIPEKNQPALRVEPSPPAPSVKPQLETSLSEETNKETAPNTPKDKGSQPVQSPPLELQSMLLMPPSERAIALLTQLNKDGFDVSRCIAEQITCICGNQRGGKGTLMAILAILCCAIDPTTRVHYFTAGDDIYPFRCDRLVCRLNYPDLDGEQADRTVAAELYKYLKVMDNGTQGSYQNIVLVIDEAVALSDYLTPDQKQWMIRFLLTRANKKGAQTFIVLHGINLTSWVGTGNTSGFSSTFKTGATFIGCEATSRKINPLRSISVATGRYFLSTSDDFSKPIERGDLGVVPNWLKTESNPATGQPDPARTLLKFFPELVSNTQVSKASVNEQIDTSHSEEKKQTNLSVTDPALSADPATEATLPERSLPPSEVEEPRKPYGISLEVFSTRIASALSKASGEASGEASTPLFEGLDCDGKLLMLRLLLCQKLGREKTILLVWGQKSGGRNHEKYKYASELFDAMIRELISLGFNEDNNWGID